MCGTICGSTGTKPGEGEPMRPRRKGTAVIASLVITMMVAVSASARPLGTEAESVINTILAVPTIKSEAGFSAKMLEEPGELYDPLFMVTHGEGVWINDDGRATDGHGSRLLAISSDGKITVLMGADELLPVTGFDIAPADFGNFGSQIFSLAQPTSAEKGAIVNHVIQRIDLAAHTVTVFCTLPLAGSVAKGVPGYGVEARFGPPGSGFAGKFYSLTALNDMIYQTLPDGTCKPFADLSTQGAPPGLTFTADGSAMLVTVSEGELVGSSMEPKSNIVRITPDSKVDPKPFASGLVRPMGSRSRPPISVRTLARFSSAIWVIFRCRSRRPKRLSEMAKFIASPTTANSSWWPAASSILLACTSSDVTYG